MLLTGDLLWSLPMDLRFHDLVISRGKKIVHLFVILHEIELFLNQQIKDGYNKIVPCKIRGIGLAPVQPNSSKFLTVLTYLTKSYILHKA